MRLVPLYSAYAVASALVCEVAFEGASKVTLLRSNVTVRNASDHAIVVAVGGGVSERVVEAGADWHVPLQVSNVATMFQFNSLFIISVAI